MNIAIASDHAGFEYKELLKKYFETKILTLIDFGTNSSESVDYPDFVHPVCQSIKKGGTFAGILICGSANGVAMTANKYQHIRAALCWNVEIAKLARLHGDSNIICIPARFVSFELACEMIDIFFQTKFEGGRHQNRLDKIKI